MKKERKRGEGLVHNKVYVEVKIPPVEFFKNFLRAEDGFLKLTSIFDRKNKVIHFDAKKGIEANCEFFVF